jgi:hypothetical protein
MLSLSAPRVHIVNSHYAKKAELDSPTLARSRVVLERSLGGGRALTRTEIAAALARAGIAAAGQRLAYLIMHAELEQVVCSGPRRGKQFTYMLIDERVPRGVTLDREAALAELTRRYFASHGPATIRDYVWWSGLTVRQAKEGLESIKSRLVHQTIGDRTYWSVGPRSRSRVSTPSVFLFPNYDECLIAYRDRDSFAEEPNHRTADPSGKPPTYFAHHIVIDGQVAGSWRRTPARGGIHVEAALQRSLTRLEKLALSEEVERLGKFMTTPATLSIH